MTRFLPFFLLLFCLSANILTAQTQVQGRVTDAETGEPLVGVNVATTQLQGTTTDLDGKYSFLINAEKTTIRFRFLGYSTVSLEVTLDGATLVQNATLKPEYSVLNTVTVTSGRHERLIESEVATVEIVPLKFIENNAVTALNEIMERTPGVQVIDNQVSIRSSGFSYGGGSRVGLIVDGQPMLGALFSDVPWNFVPIENAGQIEIVKGPASVLYGSNSMNGIINVTTADPTSKPYTSIMVYRGQMDAPPSAYKQWWDEDAPPYNVGLFFAHRVRATEKLDVVFGGNLHYNRSHIERGDEARYRLNWKTKYRLNDRTNFGINGNFMYHKVGGYFIWQDADTNSFRHISPIAFSRYRTYSLDPYFNYFDKNNNKHSIKGRVFSITEVQQNRTFQQQQANFPDIPSYVFGGEYQFQRYFDNGILLTAGALMQYFKANNPTLAFTPPDSTTRLATNGRNEALFGQVERSFFNKKLSTQIGVRVERFMTGDNDFSQFVPSAQVGASFLLTPTNVFRTSLGQGYRMPSLLERYVEAEIFNIDAGILGNFPINAIPNLGILPEYGWNYELGYKKLFKTNRLKGYLDAAFFVMQYRNMAELTLDVHLTEAELQNATLGVIRENIGFKYINKTFGRIAGYEVGAHLDGNLGRVPFRLWGGYTYTYPGDLDSIRANGQNFWNNWLTAMHAPDSILNTIMLYRSLHTARIDVEFELFKRLTLGGVVTFNGFMHNIDAVFEGKGRWGELIELLNNGPLIPGTNEFRAGQIGGDWVFDVRANVLIADGHRLHFIVTNVTNREYALRVGRMNPLRMFNIKYQMTF